MAISARRVTNRDVADSAFPTLLAYASVWQDGFSVVARRVTYRNVAAMPSVTIETVTLLRGDAEPVDTRFAYTYVTDDSLPAWFTYA